MTIQQMKDAIVTVYDTASWKKKVERMYDDQVIAIYHNFRERGILDKTLRRERPVNMYYASIDTNDPFKSSVEECEQLSFLELL